MKRPSSKSAQILRLARRRPVRARDLDAAAIPRAYLKRFVDRGLLEQVSRGLYRVPNADATELRSLADVAARVPQGIICLLSALELHGLTTEAPHAVWLMIDTHARAPHIDTPAVEIVRAHGPAHDHGVEVRRIEGVRVTITTPAKSVADCFRYRRHVGLDVAVAALCDYLGKRGNTVDALVAAARADRVYSIMRSYVEALALRTPRRTSPPPCDRDFCGSRKSDAKTSSSCSRATRTSDSFYRLSVSPHASRFVLKGAALFTLWGGAPHRATRDLDLLGFGVGTVERLRLVFDEILRLDVPDDGMS